jgi:hypothetical protein
MLEMGSIIFLPGRLANAGQKTLVCEFPEADAAQAEISHKGLAPTTAKTPVLHASGEFLLLFTSCDD